MAATLRSYLDAQSAGHGRAACGVLTATAQHQLIAVVTKAGQGLVPAHLSCPEAVELASVVAGNQLTALAHARIGQVRVQGNRATATVIASGFPRETVTLIKAGGWKIAGIPGLAG